ncbi:hypothetical protein L596_002061 [Steinernema carpocapsae]|uniref:Uncharacterized protein n=2 Tax=Steinernema carpocapsae TaxID=34508 RepID=A0A4U8UQQ9_STECR|nr:hypothetical protein L596_002061 [Steinernema carpocapsae]
MSSRVPGYKEMNRPVINLVGENMTQRDFDEYRRQRCAAWTNESTNDVDLFVEAPPMDDNLVGARSRRERQEKEPERTREKSPVKEEPESPPADPEPEEEIAGSEENYRSWRDRETTPHPLKIKKEAQKEAEKRSSPELSPVEASEAENLAEENPTENGRLRRSSRLQKNKKTN